MRKLINPRSFSKRQHPVPLSSLCLESELGAAPVPALGVVPETVTEKQEQIRGAVSHPEISRG
jgi:hypothetical protein